MRRAMMVLIAAAALAGCGGGAGELITISTTGPGEEPLRLVVTGDGRGTCNGTGERVLPSAHVIDARELERALKRAAKDRASYTDGPRGARRYVVSSNDGIVTFVEGARGAPRAVGDAILLRQNLKRDLCPEEG
jgi:hypothetical protein